jgi:hypothetical protein
MPGGGYKNFDGATGTPLPDLTVDKFGYKVYRALLGEPSVGYIVSNHTASPSVKGAVYSKLMRDSEFVWIAANGDTIDTYSDIVVINPNYADVQKVRQKFENKHQGSKFYYSNNFPK